MAWRNEIRYTRMEGFSTVDQHLSERGTTTDHVSYKTLQSYQNSSGVLNSPLVTQPLPKERPGPNTIFSPLSRPSPPPPVLASPPPILASPPPVPASPLPVPASPPPVPASGVVYSPPVTQVEPKERPGRTTIFSPLSRPSPPLPVPASPPPVPASPPPVPASPPPVPASGVVYSPPVTQVVPKERPGRTTVFSTLPRPSPPTPSITASGVLYSPPVTQAVPKEQPGRNTVFSPPPPHPLSPSPHPPSPVPAAKQPTRDWLHKTNTQYQPHQPLHPQAASEEVLNCNDAARIYGGEVFAIPQKKLPRKTYR